MSTFYERINEVIQEQLKLGLKKYEIANAAGYSKGIVAQWESGEAKSISPEGALLLEKNKGYNHKWLLFGELPKYLSEKEEIVFADNDDFDFIKFVCIKVTAGISGFAVNYLDENEYEPIYFKKSWFQRRNYNPDALYAISVNGKSMEPTLTDGSIVIVNTQDTNKKNEGLYVFNYHGEPVIKRLIKDFGGWYLSSDNPDKASYPRVLCDENTFIVGRVVHAQSEYF